MKLSILAPPLFASGPPLHTWPDPIKRILLTFTVVLVIVAYMLLGGGIIAFLIMLARGITG